MNGCGPHIPETKGDDMSGQEPPLTVDEMEELVKVSKSLLPISHLTMKDISWMPMREEYHVTIAPDGKVTKIQKDPVTMLVEGEVLWMGQTWEIGIIGNERVRRVIERKSEDIDPDEQAKLDMEWDSVR